jgi:hypothetical protein
MTPEQEAAIAAAKARRAAKPTGVTPEQQAAIDAARARRGAKPKTTGASITQDLLESGVIELMSTTENGGRVFRDTKTGGLMYSDDAYSTSDPAEIAEIMKGATAAEISMASFDKSTLDQIPAAVSGAAKFLQGVPFVGEYADELIGAVVGEDAMNNMRASQNAMGRQYPKTSMGLQFAGGVTGSIPIALAAGPAIIANAPATLAGKAALSGLVASVSGGIEGLVSGYGAGNDGDRMAAAKSRGAMGAALGGGLGVAAPLLGAGVKALVERVKGMDVKAIAKTLGISDDAAAALKPDLEALDFGAASANLRTSGPDAMLADAGGSTREALDAAITGGGKAARVGVDAVSARAAAAGEKLGKVLDIVLGVPEGIKSAVKSIATRTAPARKKAYDLAYSSAIDYAAPSGRAIEDVLDRIPPTIMKGAIDEANDAMRAAGVKNRQIMASIADDGSVTFTNPLNVQQLDEIKKALGAVLEKETDAVTGKVSAAGMRARELARDLKTALGDAVGPYKRAVKLGGDKIAEDGAMKMGREIFMPSTTREQVAETMKGASIEAQEAARRGIRTYIDDALARVRRDFGNPDADTTETMRLLNTLSSRDAREKLVRVLGAAKADRLLNEIDAVGKQFGTRQAIATGSATGRREARARALDDQLAPGVVGNAAKGQSLATLRSFVQLVTRATPQADLERKQAVLADIARALTEKRGPEAEAALALIEKAVSGQPLKNEEALRIGRLAASVGALGGYQTGQKYLASPQREMQAQ